MWLNAPDVKKLKGLRDRAILSVIIGCGLRRVEVSILSFFHIQQRESRWAIVDIVGKRDKMRTVPMPSWAKSAIDSWTYTAHIEEGFIFRRVNKGGNLMGDGLTDQAIYNIVVCQRQYSIGKSCLEFRTPFFQSRSFLTFL
jgi:site-specific recombinase XerD